MARVFSLKHVPIVNGTCESPAVDVRDFRFGAIYTPAALTACAMCFKAAPTEDGTYTEVRDDDGALLTCDSIGPSMVTVVPSGVAALGWLKLWSTDGAGANENQGADRTIYLSVKS